MRELIAMKKTMSTAELLRANELSDELITKLERIKALWAEIPGADDFDDLDKKLDGIVGNLNAAREAYGAKDFPVADDFDDLDKKLDGIVGNLNEIVEKQAEVAE